MEPEKKEKFDRYSAVKSAIGEVLRGKYIQEEGQAPHYLLTAEGKKIFRVNIIATVIGKDLQGSIATISLDDGSGKIVLRSFEENKTIDKLKIGDVLLTIGRVRVYNQEIYLSPEIVKKTSHSWLKVRSLELEKLARPGDSKTTLLTAGRESRLGQQEDEVDDADEEMVLPVEKLSRLIRDLDDGSGVPIEDVIEKSLLENTEELIQKMLENGDIFQNSPGRVRVL